MAAPWKLQLNHYPPSGQMAFHSHEEAWVCLVLDGKYQERARSAERIHSPGDMLFCPAGIGHAQRFGNEGAIKLLFTPPPGSLSYLNRREPMLDDAPFVRSPGFLRIGKRIAAELCLNDLHSRSVLEELMLDLLSGFARPAPTETRPIPPWLRRIREALDDDAPDMGSLDDLARLADRHPVHVAKTFRRYYGHTVGDYLREKRLARAALLLCGSMMPLREVAQACGYGAQPAFTRAFGAVYGLTPLDFRSRYR